MREIFLCDKCLECSELELDTGEMGVDALKYGGPLSCCRMGSDPTLCFGPYMQKKIPMPETG